MKNSRNLKKRNFEIRLKYPNNGITYLESRNQYGFK